jgi:hypothetical protein
MSEIITNTVSGLFGARGVGKTPYILGEKQYGIKGLANIALEKNMRVLIVDTFDHPSYNHINRIKPKDLATFSKLKGIHRIFVRAHEMPVLNKIINETVYNTFLVYEDAYKHQKEELDDSIMNLIGDSKGKNVDILFMYHCYALAPIDLYRYLDYLEIFKTKDSPEERKKNMRGYFKEAMETYNEVMANPSRYYHKTVWTGL